MRNLLSKTLPVALFAALMLFGPDAQSVQAAWPDKPIQIVIPWPPSGDTATTLVTAMLDDLQKELGVPVKIVNKPGGGGVIGTNEFVRARPDGYTFGIAPIGPTISQVLLGHAPYKSEDFFPLSILYYNSTALSALASAPYNDLKELAAHAKTGEVRLGDGGVGDIRYLMAMSIARHGGFEWKTITFQDLNPLVLIQKSADVMVGPAAPLRDYVAKNEIKILAMLLPQRSTAFPDVPTVAEQGFGPAYAIWAGLYAPLKTDPAIAEKFRAAFAKCFTSPRMLELMNKMGVQADASSSAAAKERFDSETVEYAKIMKELGMIK